MNFVLEYHEVHQADRSGCLDTGFGNGRIKIRAKTRKTAIKKARAFVARYESFYQKEGSCYVIDAELVQVIGTIRVAQNSKYIRD